MHGAGGGATQGEHAILDFETVSGEAVSGQALPVGSVIALNLARVLTKIGAVAEAQALYRCADGRLLLSINH